MSIVILIVILVTAFIESTIIFLPLTATILALFSVYEENPERVLGFLLLGGLELDLLQVRTLGTTSTLFLLIVFLIFLYKRKMTGKNPLFVGMAVFLSSFSYSYLVFRQFEINFIQALVLTFLTLVILKF